MIRGLDAAFRVAHETNESIPESVRQLKDFGQNLHSHHEGHTESASGAVLGVPHRRLRPWRRRAAR